MAELMQIDDPMPKGTKRKAEEDRFSPAPKRIKVELILRLGHGKVLIASRLSIKMS